MLAVIRCGPARARHIVRRWSRRSEPPLRGAKAIEAECPYERLRVHSTLPFAGVERDTHYRVGIAAMVLSSCRFARGISLPSASVAASQSWAR